MGPRARARGRGPAWRGAAWGGGCPERRPPFEGTTGRGAVRKGRRARRVACAMQQSAGRAHGCCFGAGCVEFFVVYLPACARANARCRALSYVPRVLCQFRWAPPAPAGRHDEGRRAAAASQAQGPAGCGGGEAPAGERRRSGRRACRRVGLAGREVRFGSQVRRGGAGLAEPRARGCPGVRGGVEGWAKWFRAARARETLLPPERRAGPGRA